MGAAHENKAHDILRVDRVDLSLGVGIDFRQAIVSKPEVENIVDHENGIGGIKVAEGDIIFLYTDGLSEAMRSDEEMFGEERIMRYLTANRALLPQDLLEKLEKEALEFIGGSQLTDDFTLVAAKVAPDTGTKN